MAAGGVKLRARVQHAYGEGQKGASSGPDSSHPALPRQGFLPRNATSQLKFPAHAGTLRAAGEGYNGCFPHPH